MSWYLGDVPAAQVNQGTAWADQAAHTLLTWDLEHDCDDVAGPISPDSPTWTAKGGARAYVRQEYRALLDQQQETEVRAHIEPSLAPTASSTTPPASRSRSDRPQGTASSDTPVPGSGGGLGITEGIP
ncbi:hypothetical protein HUF15_40535 [Streptomyces samsunensis]|uniref:hypothetical protein n=1 Tax=Streptomyces malaysiensis TaxID=92644 RepID=UPI0015818DB3|nr:hypothetical protein [Streptomyces samsunensis]NUH42909.1 hypothetical protein [Streptomyces samsunensis]